MDLEEAVLTRSVAARGSLPPNCFLSINVSPTFLLTSRWDAILAATGSLAGIVIEITEQDRVEDYDRIRPKIDIIRAAQGWVAVDDAGSGYASLKHIMELKPDFVKLDRFFVGNCNAENSKTTLIQMIGQATDRLDAWIIAEGVETPDELDELLRLDVPLAQGFFLGRPEPEMLPLPEAVAVVLRDRARVLEQHGSLLAHAGRCLVTGTRDEAERRIVNADEPDLAVVVDEFRRPLVLLEVHPLVGVRALEEFMRVQLSTDATTILHRALTRPSTHRFDPIVLIDEQGEFLAVARIDRLMRGVLETKVS
jgi:EAL domain-containing protein (putative c-di-GMP-specific phosphodiesterase class I)